jgi:2-dehydropantoate 2-reductase
VSDATLGAGLDRILVVGAGTIGSLFAAHLATVGEVWVLTRRAEHAAALEREGLSVTGKSELVSRPRATSDPELLPDAGLIIVATKANELEAAVAPLAGRSPGAVVMTCQNGLGADELVARRGPWPVLSSVTFMSGTRHGDARVEYELDAPTWLGPSAGRPPARATAPAVAERLVQAGLQAEAFEDVRPAIWSKLIFNATVNAVSALTCLPHETHFRDESSITGLGHLVHDLVEEGRAVAAKAGVELFEDPWAMNLEAVRRGETSGSDYRHLPSMLEDVLACRPTEVDFITGALVREGIARGVAVPLHQAMWRLVKAREEAYPSNR